ncbi:hypothetical protein [Sorangium sp. So ce1151]|uniref:hypothetical protein n=1 Tax=Sorangium sp. So ce1151 TaxID=3133332 RepID=UPI003F6396A5
MRMGSHRVAWTAGMLMVLAACGKSADDPGAAGPAASGAALEEDALGKRVLPRAVHRVRREALAPSERRVSLFVVPGDASVEVNRQPARRTDGIIELVGKEGDTHEVRVIKGEKRIEKKVTIGASSASPAFLDLNAPPPPGPPKAALKKRRDPIRFD